MTPEPLNNRVVVIGAGQAGFEVCSQLRSMGINRPISLIGAEDRLPYQRPPLSKAYLLGKINVDRLFFRPAKFFDEEKIDLHLGAPCDAIDRGARQVHLSDCSTLEYEFLVLATGAAPARLPDEIGGTLQGVHYMRGLDDADWLAPELRPGRSVLVVGGGYIGLEAAAVCAGLGLQVTIVEASERILQRVASEHTSAYFRDLHRSRGIDIRENATLERLLERDGRVGGAKLSDGSTLDADIVIVGIGVRPNQDLAAAAGLALHDGIKVDAQCRTSDSAIFAAGDCASFPSEEGYIRLESVGNAIDQAQLVARIIAGQSGFYRAKPWFWSDQYDIKLQIAGLSQGHDRAVIRKSGAESVSFWYFCQGKLIAIDAMNDPRAYMVAKRLIENGRSPDPEDVADLEIDLKDLLDMVPPA